MYLYHKGDEAGTNVKHRSYNIINSARYPGMTVGGTCTYISFIYVDPVVVFLGGLFSSAL